MMNDRSSNSRHHHDTDRRIHYTVRVQEESDWLIAFFLQAFIITLPKRLNPDEIGPSSILNGAADSILSKNLTSLIKVLSTRNSASTVSTPQYHNLIGR